LRAKLSITFQAEVDVEAVTTGDDIGDLNGMSAEDRVFMYVLAEGVELGSAMEIREQRLQHIDILKIEGDNEPCVEY
jgi:hypothetical protein